MDEDRHGYKLDLSKAFDKVPQGLIWKLIHYNIKGPVYMWIRAFLFGRRQRVIVEGSSPTVSLVSSGITQGTVLMPLVFLLFINDLPLDGKICLKKLLKCNVQNFKNPNRSFVRTIEKRIQEKLDKIWLWFVEVVFFFFFFFFEITFSHFFAEKWQVHRMTPKWSIACMTMNAKDQN